MAGQMGSRLPELSEERAAQILRNVFLECGVPENKTPFGELLERSRKHMRVPPEDGET